MLFTAAMGAMFLGEFPDALSYIGYAIVIGGAAINWAYHMIKERRAAKAAAIRENDGGITKDEPVCDRQSDRGSGGENG